MVLQKNIGNSVKRLEIDLWTLRKVSTEHYGRTDFEPFPGITVPLATIKVIEGVFSDDERQRMIEKVTEAIVAVEGENLREKTIVILDEVKSGSWGIGGKTLTAEDVKHMRGQ